MITLSTYIWTHILVVTVLTIIPTKDPINMCKSKLSKCGAKVESTNLRSLRESKYIGEF